MYRDRWRQERCIDIQRDGERLPGQQKFTERPKQEDKVNGGTQAVKKLQKQTVAADRLAQRQAEGSQCERLQKKAVRRTARLQKQPASSTVTD